MCASSRRPTGASATKPPPADIAPRAAHFVRRFATKYGKHIDAISERQLAVLEGYRWPGNVRELQHVIERAVILTQGSQLALGDWFGADPPPPSPAPSGRADEPAATLEAAERLHILKVLDE